VIELYTESNFPENFVSQMKRAPFVTAVSMLPATGCPSGWRHPVR